jgi:hypothetical protein
MERVEEILFEGKQVSLDEVTSVVEKYLFPTSADSQQELRIEVETPGKSCTFTALRQKPGLYLLSVHAPYEQSVALYFRSLEDMAESAQTITRRLFGGETKIDVRAVSSWAVE